MAKYINPFTDVGGMTRAERLQYDEALKKYRDTISVFEGVRLEGLAEGRMEGRMEGRANEKKKQSVDCWLLAHRWILFPLLQVCPRWM